MKVPLNKAQLVRSLQTSVLDVREGFLEITRHGLALLGLAVVLVSVAFLARPQLQTEASEVLLGWLQIRQIDSQEAPEPSNAALRATTQDLKTLTPEQLSVTRWLSRKYRVGPEPLAAVVTEAWALANKTQLSPTLILAIMAIESGFNPFAQSPVGAQGLMQVMTSVHHQKYAPFGGKLAAFDPVTNLRVGVRVLRACIERAGSLEGGLKFYVGAANLEGDNGYVTKVLSEQLRLQQVIEGRAVPLNASATGPATGPSTGPAAGAKAASGAMGAASVAAMATRS